MSGRTGAFVLGVVAIGAAFIPGIGPGVSMALLYAGSSVLSYALAPKIPKGVAADQGQLISDVSTLNPIPVIYGEARVGLAIVDKVVDPTNRSNASLYLVGAVCHGSRNGDGIDSINELYLSEDLAIDASGFPAGVQPKYHDGSTYYVTMEKYLGSNTQVVNTNLNSKMPTRWPTTSKGLGIAYVVLAYGYNPNVFPGGDPNPTVKVKGNKVYDPRTSTWGWSDNPALCILDYLLASVYGFGEDIANVDLESFKTAATYCDDSVEWASGQYDYRFRVNGVLDTGREPFDNTQLLLDSCRGTLIYQGSVWRLVIRSQTTVTGFKLTRDNIIGDWNFLVPGVVEAPNIMTATFTDPTQRDQQKEVQWPEEGASNPYLTEDNGFESKCEVKLGMVNKASHAKMLMITALKERRWGVLFQVLVTEAILTQQVGDLIEITHDTPGWTDQKAWLLSLELLTDGTIRASCLTYDANMYSYDYQSLQPSQPASSLPDPFVCLPPTSLVLSTDSKDPQIHVSWDPSDDGFLDHYEVWAYRATLGPKCYGTPPDEVNDAVIGPVGDDELWYVYIRAINKFGVKSTWLQGQHTTHIVKLASFSYSITEIATEIQYDITFGEDCQFVEFYSIENAGSGGANPIETTAYLAGYVSAKDGPTVKFSIATKDGNYRRTLMVGYDASWLRGDTAGPIESQAQSSGSGPTGAPTWSGTPITSITQNSCRLNWTNADANSSIRVWKDGFIIYTCTAGTTHYDVSGLKVDTTYHFNLDHIYQGVVSELAGDQEMTTDDLATAPTGFILHSGTDPNPYLQPYGRKTYVWYAMQWDTPLGAWEIYKSNGDSTPGSGSQQASGASDPTFPFEDCGLKGYHTNYYYWLRGTDPLTHWAAFSENPVDYYGLLE